jgi:UDPglucose 6-dehydrogenase
MVQNVCFVGAGRAGMSLAAVLSKHCADVSVSVTDIDYVALSSWKLHSAPFFEPNLNALVESCSNLSFVSNLSSAVAKADVVFVCLDCSPKVSGVGAGCVMDLSSWDQAARVIASCDGPLSQIIVECSTVPVHTSTTVQQILAANAPNRKFEVLCLPSFMAGGSAVQSWEDGLLFLLGSEKSPSAIAAADVVAGILSRWIQPSRIVRTNLWSAELSKMALNAYKAQRIAATFAVSALAERTGAIVDDVMKCVGQDSRLGSSCMYSKQSHFSLLFDCHGHLFLYFFSYIRVGNQVLDFVVHICCRTCTRSFICASTSICMTKQRTGVLFWRWTSSSVAG